MSIQNQIRLEQIVRRCEGYCLKRKEFISISTYHSQRCFEPRVEENEVVEEITISAIGYLPSAEERRALLGYCKYFEERKEK